MQNRSQQKDDTKVIPTITIDFANLSEQDFLLLQVLFICNDREIYDAFENYEVVFRGEKYQLSLNAELERLANDSKTYVIRTYHPDQKRLLIQVGQHYWVKPFEYMQLGPKELPEYQDLLIALVKFYAAQGIKALECGYYKWPTEFAAKINVQLTQPYFELVDTLIFDNSHFSPSSMHVYAATNLVGEGGFGEVCEVEKYTLDEQNVLHEITPKHQQIVKIIKRGNKLTHEHAMREYALGSKAGHLHLRQPVYLSDFAFIVGRMFSSGDLHTLLDQCTTGTKKLSLEDRLTLICNMLYAVAQQVHARKIVHGDIKPENILITENLQCKIIDFNLSSEMHSDWRLCGTEEYLPPEAYKALARNRKLPLNDSFDVYSLALVILKIFNATVNLKGKESFAKAQFLKLKPAIQHIGQNIQGFTAPIQQQISRILKSMLTQNPQKRASVLECLQQFELVRISLATAETQTVAASVHALAVRLRAIFIEAGEFHSCKKMDEVDLDEIFLSLFATVEKLEDTPDAIKSFAACLHIRAFAACETKEDLVKTVQDIWSKFSEQIARMNLYVRQINLLPQSAGKQQVEMMLKHLVALDYYFSIDNLAKINSKFARYLPKVEAMLTQLESDQRASVQHLPKLSFLTAKEGDRPVADLKSASFSLN